MEGSIGKTYDRQDSQNKISKMSEKTQQSR